MNLPDRLEALSCTPGEHEYAPSGKWDRFTWLFALPSLLISLILHLILLAIAALIVFATPTQAPLTLDAGAAQLEVLQEVELPDTALAVQQPSLLEVDNSPSLTNTLEFVPPALPKLPQVLDIPDWPVAAATGPLADGATSPSLSFSHRSNSQRQGLAQKYGASTASEQAVELGLAWLAKHQHKDGGWDLDHQRGGGAEQMSPNPGKPAGRIGATALALLPFLGKGYTQRQDYSDKATVRRGLSFLITSIRDEGPNGGSMLDQTGEMYSHALATICLCEAFGMTKDPMLEEPVRAALKYIIYSQDPVGGGWRYTPREPGDTSVLGWQLMALKSAQMACVPHSPGVYERVGRFLDHVQTEKGARYAYMDPAEVARPSTTAIGLLCRMYLGWKQAHPELQAAVAEMAEVGPDRRTGDGTQANMYYNYYATQVMRHIGGPKWDQWNVAMRDFLVRTQATEGVASGSWFFRDELSSEHGGRLYVTSMCLLTLEVYYRHLPLYREEVLADDFPLE